MAVSRRNPMTDLALVAVFAALIAAFAAVPPIPISGTSVPITLQTFAIAITGMLLGPWRGFLATGLYVVAGLAGLPVFAGGHSGIGVLSGPSGGYLISFPFYAAAVGWFAVIALRHGLRRAPLGLSVGGIIASLAVNHSLGILGMMHAMHIGFGKAWGFDSVFIPGDIAKTIVAAFIAVAVHRAFPTLVLARTRRHQSPVAA